MEKSELPKRKRNRLKNYNYNWTSSYFLTLCTLDRKCILSNVTKKVIKNNADSSEKLVPVNAFVELTDIGKTVEKYILATNEYYENIDIENYVIMPNHIHLLIYITDNESHSKGANAIVPKYVSTLKRFINKEIEYNIFQRSYYDHIIRNEKDFNETWDYIDANPIVWNKDFLYTDVENGKV